MYHTNKTATNRHSIDYRLNCQLPWLRDIPSHWQVRRGKVLFQQISRPVTEKDGVITAFRDGVVTLRSNRRTEGFTEAIKEIGYQGIRKGDLIIHAMDAFAGAVGVSDADGKASPVYVVCRPRIQLNVHYYAYLLRHMAHANYILALAKGIRERSTDFRFSDFGSLSLPVPPLQEQDNIVQFLDRELAKIKSYAEIQKRLTGLLPGSSQSKSGVLQEYRIALVDLAVIGKIDVQTEASSGTMQL